ncbi:hypothetical protein NQ315_005404 [Exocentrus adspersus]|uniref:Uncharacterized protein n=1 Tax=Exocentrus adspersus TaxID=1586481 RepID=A0AAV8W2G8_9CUCU|nr:hypothetical protein NQ315_005404 [Exocentrus adspersus]
MSAMEDRANILREMRVCRFCLSSDENVLTNIYDKHSTDTKQSVPLPLQIMACIAIEVFKNDGMPQLICNYCRKLTLHAYTFKTNCKKADDALKLFLATGQLSKPYIQKIEEASRELYIKINEPSPPRKMRILNTGMSASSSIIGQKSKSKRVRMEDGTEIITLNFNPQEEEDEVTVHQGENEHETILGYEEHTQRCDEDPSLEEGEQLVAVEEDESINPVLKVNQVKTDCFPCPHCDRTFPLKQLLDLHLPNHDRERRFKCDECTRRYFTKYDLHKHIQTHNEDKPFDCIVCNKSFSRESLLKRHEKIHIDVPKYVCSQCDKTFLTKQYLDAHQAKHKKRRPFTCQVCNKSFVFKQVPMGLERHEVVHSENKPHKCNYCEASFTSAIKLTRHITSHAGLRPYPCKLCGRTFLLSHHLTRHMRSHYAAHSSSPETVIGQHKCDICSMSFRRKDSLINHSAIHSMVNLRCVICNTTFETANMVKEHITTHLAGLPHPCEKCDYSFETAEQLEEHELKHAEMEYEEQIEKEVMSEALQQQEENSEEYEEGEVTEYTIADLNNSDVVPTPKKRRSGRNVSRIGSFLKDEMDSDLEEGEASSSNNEKAAPPTQDEEEEVVEQLEHIKPIIRQEGTKVYQRKAPLERKMPKIVRQPIMVAPLEQINQSESRIENVNLTSDINTLPNKKIVNMKLGEKVVRVQKFIVTKEEMKAMAKQGILEMKGGQVVLKNPGHPILNATLKPIQKGDIESLIDKKSNSKQQIKKYQARSGLERISDPSLLFPDKSADNKN